MHLIKGIYVCIYLSGLSRMASIYLFVEFGNFWLEVSRLQAALAAHHPQPSLSVEAAGELLANAGDGFRPENRRGTVQVQAQLDLGGDLVHVLTARAAGAGEADREQASGKHSLIGDLEVSKAGHPEASGSEANPQDPREGASRPGRDTIADASPGGRPNPPAATLERAHDQGVQTEFF